MRTWICLLLAFMVVFLDQLTKILASAYLLPYQPEDILPFMNLTLAYNTGAAFSFLHSAGQWHRWFFVAFSSLASTGLTFWLYRTQPEERLKRFAISLVLGGAVGNLIDRACFGYVVDFIDLYVNAYHWPVFNVADMAISFGAGLLILDTARHKS